MELTPEDIAYFRQLDHDRDRALAQGFTTSNIPVSEKHEKWIEYKKIEKLVHSPQSIPAPRNEHVIAQFPSPPLATSMATPRSAFPNQEQNMMLNLALGPTAQVSSKARFCVYCLELMPALERLVVTGGKPSIASVDTGNGPIACQRSVWQLASRQQFTSTLLAWHFQSSALLATNVSLYFRKTWSHCSRHDLRFR